MKKYQKLVRKLCLDKTVDIEKEENFSFGGLEISELTQTQKMIILYSLIEEKGFSFEK